MTAAIIRVADATEGRFTLPAINLPDFSLAGPAAGDFPVVPAERGRAVARATRRHWGMRNGPIAAMVKTMEAYGVRLFRGDAAAWFWDAGRPFALLAPNEGHIRGRFIAATMLGHLVMRHGEQPHRDEVVEALTFACEFLAPVAGFAKDMPRHPTPIRLAEVAKRWSVPCAMLVAHACDAGLYTPAVASGMRDAAERVVEVPALHETSYVYERVLALGRMEWLAEEADMTMRSLMCLLLLPDGLETTVAFPAQRRTPAPRKRRGERGVVLNLDDYRRPR